MGWNTSGKGVEMEDKGMRQSDWCFVVRENWPYVPRPQVPGESDWEEDGTKIKVEEAEKDRLGERKGQINAVVQQKLTIISCENRQVHFS